MILEIKKLYPDAKLPEYAKQGDAAFDLYSYESQPINLDPGKRRTVKTGIAMAIPEGYAGIIKGRSGFAHKNGIDVLAGVIDSGYRGEIGVVLVNLGEETLKINKNDRIAQMLIQPVHTVEFKEVPALTETVRGTSGFGSSGIQ